MVRTRAASAGLPVLVAELDGSVIGFATYGPWRPKTGYRFTVENSVYVHPDHRGRGAANALMPALIERARAGDVHSIVAGIEATNAGSIALHEKFGFRQVALLPEVGFKFGRWLDLTYLQPDAICELGASLGQEAVVDELTHRAGVRRSQVAGVAVEQ